MVSHMKRFEYEITRHPSGEFQRLAYFCTAGGDCRIDQLQQDQAAILRDILNERGSLGWELVQLTFGKDGVVVFWKREVETA